MGFKREIAAKFNRFSVNHPRKKDILQINASVWGAAGIGMVLTPFDGGLTLLALLISGTGTGVVATMDKDEIKKHLNATGAEKVTVDGEEYVVTVSQAQKLEKCNKKIRESISYFYSL